MRLTRLKVSQYKNINSLKIDLHPSINAFTGMNGVGKTNILDTIHYLCLAKSNFGRLERNNVMFEKEFFRLEGDFLNFDNKYEIVFKVKPPRVKTIEKNGKAIKKVAEHIGEFPLVIIAPRDKNALLENSKERRKLMDRALSQTDKSYLNALVEYNKLIKQRNALLRDSDFNSVNTILLNTYDEQLEPLVNLISMKRKDFVNQILPDFMQIYKEISSGEEIPHIKYDSQIEGDNYLDLVKRNLQKDIVLSRSTTGIHKDDLKFELNNRDLRHFASQGQLKSFALAIKLAEFSFLKKIKGFEPIVILDDVFDKLDKLRVQKLVSLLFNESFGQVFVSDTDKARVLEIFKKSGVSFTLFEVDAGDIGNIVNSKT